jgi:transposase
MRKANKYELTQEELASISDAIRYDKRPEVVKRATALRLLHEGRSPDDVAEFVGVTAPSIHNWRKRWQEGQLEGLSNRPIVGRPSKTTADYWEKLDKVLEQNPRDLGYIFSIWTTERLAQHLATETGIVVSSERLRVLMAQHDYVYRRPRADLSIQQDATARVEAEKQLEDLKKKPKGGILSYSLWMKAP